MLLVGDGCRAVMCTSVHVVSCDAGFGVVAACSYTAALGVSGGFPGHHVIASFWVHVWQGAVCAVFPLLVPSSLQLCLDVGGLHIPSFTSCPGAPAPYYACAPFRTVVWAVRQGFCVLTVLCGVLAPPHACHARCYVSCGIKHVQLLCLCCACDVGL